MGNGTLFNLVVDRIGQPSWGIEHVKKLSNDLSNILDASDRSSPFQSGVPDVLRPQLEAWMADCIDGELPPEVLRMLDKLDRGGQVGQVNLNEFLTSLTLLFRNNLLNLYRRILLRALTLMVILCGCSIPVFMAVEGWDGGDAAWFTFITFTTIGLGDLTPTHGAGLIYWYFFVFTTLGLLSLAIDNGIFAVSGTLQPIGHRIKGLVPWNKDRR